MDKNKINIQYYELSDIEKNWMVVRFSGGYCTKKLYERSTYTELEVNPAFMYLFSVWLKENTKELSLEVINEIDVDSLYITIAGNAEGFENDIRKFMKIILDKKIEERDFSDIKEKTMKQMRKNYKDPEYRGWMKMQEFVHQRKGFDVQSLLMDMKNITYKEFKIAEETLICPENISISIGTKKSIKDYDFVVMPLQEKHTGRNGYVADFEKQAHEISQKDWVRTENSRREYAIGAVRFDYENNLSSLERKLMMDVMGVLLYSENVVGYSDQVDSCIIYWNQPWKKQRIACQEIMTMENYRKAGIILLEQIRKKMQKYPGYFLKECIQMEVQGIVPGEYIQMLAEDLDKRMDEIISKSPVCITEGRLVYQHDGKER